MASHLNLLSCNIKNVHYMFVLINKLHSVCIECVFTTGSNHINQYDIIQEKYTVHKSGLMTMRVSQNISYANGNDQITLVNW